MRVCCFLNSLQITGKCLEGRAGMTATVMYNYIST